jgi:hypothetical protein
MNLKHVRTVSRAPISGPVVWGANTIFVRGANISSFPAAGIQISVNTGDVVGSRFDQWNVELPGHMQQLQKNRDKVFHRTSEFTDSFFHLNSCRA